MLNIEIVATHPNDLDVNDLSDWLESMGHYVDSVVVVDRNTRAVAKAVKF